MNYLNAHGEVVTKTMKEIKAESGKPISWAKMHEIHKYSQRLKTTTTSREAITYTYLKKFLGKVTIFDFNNMMEWGYLYLYPHWQGVVIKNGAKDKRKVKE